MNEFNDIYVVDDLVYTDVSDVDTLEDLKKELDEELEEEVASDDVSDTECLTVSGTQPATTNDDIIAKLDIIIMLLIVFLAVKMFSQLANVDKQIPHKNKKER